MSDEKAAVTIFTALFEKYERARSKTDWLERDSEYEEARRELKLHVRQLEQDSWALHQIQHCLGVQSR